MITIEFKGNISNDSLQVGDLAYYVKTVATNGFNQSTSEPIFIGVIDSFDESEMDIDNTTSTVQAGDIEEDDFIMFAKDSLVNLSGLIGYYAEVTIKNDSVDKAEMYSIASEATLSSK